MKKLIALGGSIFLLAAGAQPVRISPVAGTQPADYSFLCKKRFAQGQPTKKTVPLAELDVRSCDVSAWDFSVYSAQELADVLMYYNDVMLCYGITPEELKEAYTRKFEKNMTRW